MAYSETFFVPREISRQEIEGLKRDRLRAPRRAVEAGFDVFEVHAAHGHLVHEFLSPVSNKRTDEYGGGGVEGRTRLLLEIVEGVRAAIPDKMPLFVRISATDRLEEVEGFGPEARWTVEESAKLAGLLADRGVDLLDVLSGGKDPKRHPHA